MNKDSNIIVNLIAFITIVMIILMILLFGLGRLEKNLFFDTTAKVENTVAYTQAAGTDGDYFILYYDNNTITDEEKKSINTWNDYYSAYIPLYLVDTSAEANLGVVAAEENIPVGPDAVDSAAIKVKPNEMTLVYVMTEFNEDTQTSVTSIQEVKSSDEVIPFLNEKGSEKALEATSKEAG